MSVQLDTLDVSDNNSGGELPTLEEGGNASAEETTDDVTEPLHPSEENSGLHSSSVSETERTWKDRFLYPDENDACMYKGRYRAKRKYLALTLCCLCVFVPIAIHLAVYVQRLRNTFANADFEIEEFGLGNLCDTDWEYYLRFSYTNQFARFSILGVSLKISQVDAESGNKLLASTSLGTKDLDSIGETGRYSQYISNGVFRFQRENMLSLARQALDDMGGNESETVLSGTKFLLKTEVSVRAPVFFGIKFTREFETEFVVGEQETEQEAESERTASVDQTSVSMDFNLTEGLHAVHFAIIGVALIEKNASRAKCFGEGKPFLVQFAEK